MTDPRLTKAGERFRRRHREPQQKLTGTIYDILLSKPLVEDAEYYPDSKVFVTLIEGYHWRTGRQDPSRSMVFDSIEIALRILETHADPDTEETL